MRREDIVIRDPFILSDNGRYYLYGTRSETAWTDATGFDVYVSADLENWSGPREIFHRDEHFWADKEFWAPEVIAYRDKYYMFATLGAHSHKKGIQIFVSDKPDGWFTPLTDSVITPEDWESLDATTFIDEDGHCCMVFSHSVPEEPKGAMVLARLSDDLTHIQSELQTLFFASDAEWTRPIPFAKQEFGADGENYFSDGPYLFYNSERQLCMLWSSWSERGYAMGVSVSESEKIEGPWKHEAEPRFYGGGHGMVFYDSCECAYVLWHAPNDSMKEKPVFIPLTEFMGHN